MTTKEEFDRRRYLKHTDKIKARTLKYFYGVVKPQQEKEKKRKENKKASARKWQEKNKEHLNEYMRLWREKNKEAWKEINDKAYYKRRGKKLKEKFLDMMYSRKLKKLRAQKNNIMVGRLLEMYPKGEILSWVA
jgi:hypothetical protein